jgi:MerR family transcriptional regulator/heat shock protein HspR
VAEQLNNHSYFSTRLTAKYTMAITVMITGVAAHKIRKYEECGLCKPERTPSRQRLFSDADIEIIRKITIFEKDGVNLQGIKIILNMQNNPGKD